MSNKNKIENKSIRRSERAAITVLDRTPISEAAPSTLVRILTSPKQKLNGRTRRRIQNSRGSIVRRPLCLTISHPAEVKVTLKLQALPLLKLIRRLKQSARRASTCGNLLRDIHPKSKYIPGLQAEQTHQLSLCRQIAAEISVRNHNTQH